MKRYTLATISAEERATILRRSSKEVFDESLYQSVSAIIEDVREHGDEALVRATERFDEVKLRKSQLRVRPEEIATAVATLSPDLLAAIDEAIANVRRFNQRIVDSASWREEIAPGVQVGEQASPLDRIGLYVPCRKGSFPSVLIHQATPAVVAGVLEIAVVLPPLFFGDGAVDPATLAVAGRLGITEIYRCAGVAGIAAMALGTETIRPVRRITGAGSPPIAAAQLAVQRYGVAVGLLYGPSEAVILADGGADPDLLAADLLNDAEHGNDSAALLVTDSAALIDAVALRVEARLAELPETQQHRAAAATSRYGGAVLASDMEEAVAFVNEYGPEHLQIATDDPEEILPRIRNAGEILLGQNTPFVAGDYSIGITNTLPTGGFAAVSSGVTARTYLKFSTIGRLNREALASLRPGIRALARHEGFPAHIAALDAPGR